MAEPIQPEDPSRVTKDNPYGFYSKPIPPDYDYVPMTEEEAFALMAAPPGRPIIDLVNELLTEIDGGVTR